mgnify:CR=1 FL=1
MIQLLKGPAFGLWQAEVSPGTGNDWESTKNEACLAPKVTFIRVYHVRRRERHNQSPEILRKETNADAVWPQPSGRHFSADHVSKRSKSEVVEEVPDDNQYALAHGSGGVVTRYNVENANDEENHSENEHTRDESSATDHVDDPPRADVS